MKDDLILAACVTACRNALAGVDGPRSHKILEIVRSEWTPANGWSHWSEVDIPVPVALKAMRLYAEVAPQSKYCPICGAEVEFQGYQPGELDVVRENWGCNTCETSWTEVFEYVRRECVDLRDGGEK
jgi:hypothetical protein